MEEAMVMSGYVCPSPGKAVKKRTGFGLPGGSSFAGVGVAMFNLT
jgi:hypothetical protein